MKLLAENTLTLVDLQSNSTEHQRKELFSHNSRTYYNYSPPHEGWRGSQQRLEWEDLGGGGEGRC